MFIVRYCCNIISIPFVLFFALVIHCGQFHYRNAN
jgi:hypothetical protein